MMQFRKFFTQIQHWHSIQKLVYSKLVSGNNNQLTGKGMFSIRKIIEVLLFLLATFAISSCGESSPYPILESGVKPGVGSIYWLDNERVLFSGVPKASRNLVNPKWVGVHGLYIWNIKKQSIELYKKSRGHVCYHDGYIVYGADMDNAAKQKYREKYGAEARYPYWEGMMGEETYRSYKNNFLGEKRGPNLWRSPVSCRLHSKPENGGRLLLEESEYIEGNDANGNPLVYRHETKVIKQLLPLPLKTTYKTFYVPFDGRYFMHTVFHASMAEPCRHGKCLAVWWIDRVGATEKILIPYADIAHGSYVGIYPIKQGFFVEVDTSTKSKWGGAYIINSDDSVKQMIQGHVSNPAVSPDGCKVAFTYRRPDKGTNYYLRFIVSPKAKDTKLKMIDFCNKNN